MKQTPLDPETQFSELLAQFDEALATASDSSSITTQPFISNLADAELQRRFDRVHNCLQLLEQDRRRQTANAIKDKSALQQAPVPHEIGRFRVIRRLGSGGFGVVFLAEDPVLRRHVAIKLPLASIFQSQELHDRFLRECRAAAMLNHPGIVRVLESGDIQGIPYQVAEFVDGERLSDLLKRERPSVKWSAIIVRGLADAVQHAHDHGVLHRDIKPDNILMQTQHLAEGRDSLSRNALVSGFPDDNVEPTTEASGVRLINATLSPDPVPRITDFGLARLADDDSSLSSSGMLVGTPKYMSPEQLHGKIRLQGPPTDIYALGVVLHELLTGSVPFADAEGLQSRIAISSNSVPAFRSRHTGISRDLETICLKCLQLRPADRYASAGDLRDDLSRYLDGRPTFARPIPTHEQFTRWVTGNRKLAGLLGLLTLLITVVFVQAIRNERASHEQNTTLSSTLSQLTVEKQRADESLKQANTSRIEAVQSESRFREIAWLAQQGEYSGAMMQASSLWHRGEIGLMNQTLMPFLPKMDNELSGFEWRYLWDQGQTLRSMMGHTGTVKGLAVAADEKHVYSIGEDNTIRLWHLDSGVLESTWRLDGEGRGSRVAISQNSRRAVISRILDKEGKNDVVVWDLVAGGVLMRRSFSINETLAVAISNDGNTVLVGGERRTGANANSAFVELWSPDADRVTKDDSTFDTLVVDDVRTPGIAVYAMAFGPDAHTIMIGVLAEIEVGGEAEKHTYYQLLQTSLNVVAAASQDDSVSVFGPLRQIQWHQGLPMHMTFSHDGRYFATILGDNPHVSRCWADVWDMDSGKLVRETESFSRAIGSMAFDSVGTKLGLGLTVPGSNSDGKPVKPGEKTLTQARPEMRLWDFVSDTTQTLPFEAIRGIEFLKPLDSANNNSWFIGQEGGALKAWQPGAVLPFRELKGHHPKEVWDLATSGDGSTVFSVGDDHMLRSWNLTSGVEKTSASPRSILVSCVAVSPDGLWVAAGGYDDEVVVYDTRSFNPVATLNGHANDLRTLTFSPDSRLLATGGRDAIVRLWNVPGFDLAGIREGHGNTVRSLTWTGDGQLYSSDGGGRVLAWDSNGHVIRERMETEGVHSLAFAPAGLRIPLPTANQDVSSFNPKTPKSNNTQETNAQSILTLQADELLALGMNHGTVRLWHLPTDSIFFETQHHGVEIRSLAFSPDGRTLAVGGSDEAVYLWHVATGRNVLTFDQLGSSVHRVAFSPDGASLLAAMHDGTIRIWRAPTVP